MESLWCQAAGAPRWEPLRGVARSGACTRGLGWKPTRAVAREGGCTRPCTVNRGHALSSAGKVVVLRVTMMMLVEMMMVTMLVVLLMIFVRRHLPAW